MIDEELLAALRQALARRLSSREGDGELRSALRDVSREAQRRGLHAEQLVIALKRVWDEIPEVRAAGSREARLRMLERVVTLCIEEYYTEEGA